MDAARELFWIILLSLAVWLAWVIPALIWTWRTSRWR